MQSSKITFGIKMVLVTAMVFEGFTANFGQTTHLDYINYHFENGSPLFYEIQDDSSVLVNLIYDQERNSPNRAAGHWHFQVFARKNAVMKIVLQNFNNIWNGQTGSAISHITTCYYSVDGKNWEVLQTTMTSENQLEIELIMPEDSVYLARLEPYRISELDKLISEIENHPLAQITDIGKTVENRSLEILRIGNENALNQVLIRGRAHAWESGGSWVIEGLIRSLLGNDPKNRKFLEMYCLYILPMANKDGVAHGRTRFNLQGMDLNRKWDKIADPNLSPENAALEKWLEHQVALDLKPDLAIDLHNDSGGNLHFSRPDINLDQYLENMERFERLLKKYSWFTEGSLGSDFRNKGTYGEGLLERYHIDALIYELNANWIAGLNKEPFGRDWMLLGEQLRMVFFKYFSQGNGK